MKVDPCFDERVSEQSDPQHWLRFAHDDLAAARLLMSDPRLPARLACFHAQQAAEKALKASLVRLGVEFRKTHDLTVLSLLQPGVVQAEVGQLDLQRLQQWAVDARYPADLPDLAANEAGAILTIAEEVVAVIARTMQGRQQP